jgi:hypothetical protein
MYFSQQTIIGFLGAHPEVKHLPNGTPVLRLTVATKKSWKDPQTRSGRTARNGITWSPTETTSCASPCASRRALMSLCKAR